MIIELDREYAFRPLIYPIKNDREELTGVTLVAEVIASQTPALRPEGDQIRDLSDDRHLLLFVEKVKVLERLRDYFIRERIYCWLPINEFIARAIIINSYLASRLEQLPFIELAISENFPDLNKGRENMTLTRLAQRYPLVLENFGDGHITSRPITNGLFRRVMLDSAFVQRQADAVAFDPFMRAIASRLSPYAEMLVGGINSDALRLRALAAGFSAMQGPLWPAVSIDTIAMQVRS